MLELPLNTPESSQNLQSQLDIILNKPLEVERIDDYAKEALESLIDLIQRVTIDYDQEYAEYFGTGAELEREAFSYFGLGDIEATLDHIADKASEIQRLDGLIDKADIINQVIVPPDRREYPESTGESETREKKIIPRLKTLLFILGNDFAVDLNDKDQVRLAQGVLRDSMARETSYYLAEMPVLARTVLVCDEEGNVTYVFDNDLLKQIGLRPEDLVRRSKEQLNQLLDHEIKLGQRIVYSANFISNILLALQDPSGKASPVQVDSNEVGKYLYPKAPDKFLTTMDFAEVLGISRNAVRTTVEELSETLGEVRRYRFKYQTVNGYSPEQQILIRQDLESRGVLSESAPPGVLNVSGMAKTMNVPTKNIINQAIAELRDSLGETRLYKFGPRTTVGYSEEQQSLIFEYLKAIGYYDTPPTGFMHEYGLSQELGIVSSLIQRAIGELGSDLGEIKLYKSTSRIVAYYSPSQQRMIRQWLETNGLLQDKVPEGFASINGIAKELDVSHKTVDRAINKLGESLGEVQTYKFMSQTTRAYSPLQQEMIRQQLEHASVFVDNAPQGVLSLSGMGTLFGIDYKPLHTAIKALEGLLEEPKKYKFGSRDKIGEGYTLRDQELIREYLTANGYFDIAPEGFLNKAGLVEQFGVQYDIINKIIDGLGDSLGETKKYKARSGPTIYYSPEQQKLMLERLDLEGYLDNDPPEGYLTTAAIAEALNTSFGTIERAAVRLGAALGETKKYRFKTRVTIGYSSEQIGMIRQYLIENNIMREL